MDAGDIWEALTATSPPPRIVLPDAAPSLTPTAAQFKLAIDSHAQEVFQRIIKPHSALR